MENNRKDEAFVVKGLAGTRGLSGSVAVSGSKNAVLKAIAASLLFDVEVDYTRVPDIEDVSRSYELLEKLGARVTRTDAGARIGTSDVTGGTLDREIAKRMRASVVLTGPLLARFGNVVFPHPGGCVIGERPIDLFLKSFQAMGALVEERDTMYYVTAKNGLHGADIFLSVPSITVTETLIMAGTLASGTTVIRNAAMEPEIGYLARMLQSAGADISGVGTPVITVEGRNGKLFTQTVSYETPPDRVEAGSFLILGALCAQELTITDCLPNEFQSLIEHLRKAGVPLEIEKDRITVRAQKEHGALSVKTHEYPGFPTDLQAPMVVFLTQAKGESRLFETIFEGRFHYIQDLVWMGADIRLVSDREVTIHGPCQLEDRELKSPDLRAGLAFIIAAAVASGTSKIYDIYSIDRGYEHIERKLQAIGLDIQRVAT